MREVSVGVAQAAAWSAGSTGCQHEWPQQAGTPHSTTVPLCVSTNPAPLQVPCGLLLHARLPGLRLGAASAELQAGLADGFTRQLELSMQHAS